jgi:hypothetical protein
MRLHLADPQKPRKMLGKAWRAGVAGQSPAARMALANVKPVAVFAENFLCEI